MRSDGILIQSADPLHSIMPYIMKRRCDSMVMVTLNIPLDPLKNYTRKKRREGGAVSHLAVIVAAVLRTIREYPHFDRFVVNKKIYQHTDFSIGALMFLDKHGLLPRALIKASPFHASMAISNLASLNTPHI